MEAELSTAMALQDWVLCVRKQFWSTGSVRMWVQGLGRGWIAVQCAAVQGGCAVKARVGAVELSVAGCNGVCRASKSCGEDCV